MSRHLLGRLALPVLLTLAWTPFAVGQSRERGPLVLDLPASIRGLALGNTFVLGSRDPDAIFSHPGDLRRAQGLRGSLQRFGPVGTVTTLSAGQSWFGGGVALGIQHLSYELPFQSPFRASRVLELPMDEGTLREQGESAASELVVSAGYGRSILGIQGGVTGKVVEQRVGPHKGTTAAVDLGLAHSPGPLTIALSVQNLGPELPLGEEDIPLPTRFTLGAFSQTTPVGPLDLALGSALTYRLDGDLDPSVGMEVSYWPVTGRTFLGRIGYRHRSDDYSSWPLTLGAAFFGDNITLEYAFQGFEDGDPAHAFGVGWR